MGDRTQRTYSSGPMTTTDSPVRQWLRSTRRRREAATALAVAAGTPERPIQIDNDDDRSDSDGEPPPRRNNATYADACDGTRFGWTYDDLAVLETVRIQTTVPYATGRSEIDKHLKRLGNPAWAPNVRRWDLDLIQNSPPDVVKAIAEAVAAHHLQTTVFGLTVRINPDNVANYTAAVLLRPFTDEKTRFTSLTSLRLHGLVLGGRFGCAGLCLNAIQTVAPKLKQLDLSVSRPTIAFLEGLYATSVPVLRSLAFDCDDDLRNASSSEANQAERETYFGGFWEWMGALPKLTDWSFRMRTGSPFEVGIRDAMPTRSYRDDRVYRRGRLTLPYMVACESFERSEFVKFIQRLPRCQRFEALPPNYGAYSARSRLTPFAWRCLGSVATEKLVLSGWPIADPKVLRSILEDVGPETVPSWTTVVRIAAGVTLASLRTQVGAGLLNRALESKLLSIEKEDAGPHRSATEAPGRADPPPKAADWRNPNSLEVCRSRMEAFVDNLVRTANTGETFADRLARWPWTKPDAMRLLCIDEIAAVEDQRRFVRTMMLHWHPDKLTGHRYQREIEAVFKECMRITEFSFKN